MKRIAPLPLSSLLLFACGDTGDSGASVGTSITASTTASSGGDTDTGDTSDTGASGASSASTTDSSGGSTDTSDPTGASSDSTTDSSGGSSSGANFISEPDGGQTNECDVWAQDCPAGEKCMPWANDGGNSWNALKCSPLDPNPNQPGDPCTVEGSGVSGVDDCALGSMCWDVDPETAMGYCVSFCMGSEASPTCADSGTACTIYNDGVLPLCLPGCDPLLQDCGNMNVCVAAASGEGFVCVLDASGTAGVAGDPCEYVNVCDPGLFCADAAALPSCQGAIGCCSEFCDLSAADPSAACTCASGGCECVPWYEAGTAPPGLDDVGGCVLPA